VLREANEENRIKVVAALSFVEAVLKRQQGTEGLCEEHRIIPALPKVRFY
jgi:hypothetical protein